MARGVPVSDLVVLTLGDIDQDLGGRMFDIEQSQDGGSIVGDGGVLLGGDHLVHSSGAWIGWGVPRVVLTMSTMA